MHIYCAIELTDRRETSVKYWRDKMNLNLSSKYCFLWLKQLYPKVHIEIYFLSSQAEKKSIDLHELVCKNRYIVCTKKNSKRKSIWNISTWWIIPYLLWSWIDHSSIDELRKHCMNFCRYFDHYSKERLCCNFNDKYGLTLN